MFALLGLPIDVAYHLVSALAGAFAPLPGGLAVAAAIVLFTIMVRLLVLPLSYYAFRGQRAQARIAPQIQELYKRHSGQPERLQRELSALRAREGAGVFTGCLPALLQIPFFTVVYRLFLSGTVGGRPNLLLHQHLFSALNQRHHTKLGCPPQTLNDSRGQLFRFHFIFRPDPGHVILKSLRQAPFQLLKVGILPTGKELSK